MSVKTAKQDLSPNKAIAVYIAAMVLSNALLFRLEFYVAVSEIFI